jgi:hypothetical protein
MSWRYVVGTRRVRLRSAGGRLSCRGKFYIGFGFGFVSKGLDKCKLIFQI